MKNFTYIAMDREGNEKQGFVVANSYQDAVEKIKEMNLYPSDIREASVADNMPAEIPLPASLLSRLFQHKVSSRQLVPFVSDLAVLIESGVPLVRALTVLSRQMLSARVRGVLSDLRADVESGQSLSSAMHKHPRIFSQLFVNMVRAGEIGGVLPEVLNRLSLLYEKQARLNAKIRAAMTYPITVLLFALLVVAFMLTVIVPKFFIIFDELGVKLPAITLILQHISLLIQHFWLLIGGMIFVLVIVVRVIMRIAKVRYFCDSLSVQLPVIGMLVRKISISRFCRIFGTLRASGVPILQTLAVAKDACDNMVIAYVIERVQESIREGESVAAPLSGYPVFPPLVINMIAVGEETGTLSSMLIKIADRYDEEVDVVISQLTSLLEPFLIIGLGVIVLAIILGLFSPLVVLVQSLGGA